MLMLGGSQAQSPKPVRELIAAQNGRLKLFFLSLCGPHLTPDAQVWSNVKARVSKQMLTNKPSLIN
jgi:hypothetical protein